MKRTLPLIIAIVLAAAVATAQSGRRPAPSPVAPPQPAETPETPIVKQTEAPVGVRMLPESVYKHEFRSLEKESFRLSDFGGKVIVINLWATWCGPCRNEIPEYEMVRKEYTSRGVEFFGLTTENPDSDAERVRKFVREFDFHFHIAWLDRPTAITLMNGRGVIPQTIVVAANGQVVEHWRGYAPGGQSASMLRRAIGRALAVEADSGAR
jgi:thiol-disulfide isomerase/thioredoxin